VWVCDHRGVDAPTANVEEPRPNPGLDGEPMRVVVADDHILLREGVARLLADSGLLIVGQAGDADRLLELVHAQRPDVALVDIRMPPSHTTDGLVAALRIRDEYPAIGVLLLSQFVETHYAVQLLGSSSGRVGTS
jgi:DNA-binding NarL/FixJ family response regulator